LAESGLFNGLRRIQIKFFLSFPKTRSGCKKRPSALEGRPSKRGRNALHSRLSPYADLTLEFGFAQPNVRGSWLTALSAIDIRARPIPVVNRQSSSQYVRIIRHFQARAFRFHSARERRRTETRAEPPRAPLAWLVSDMLRALTLLTSSASRCEASSFPRTSSPTAQASGRAFTSPGAKIGMNEYSYCGRLSRWLWRWTIRTFLR
jgi:hypothetical protein